MKRGTGKILVAASIFAVMLIIPFASAGILDDLFGRITGQVTNTTNVSVSVSGSNPVTIAVKNETMTGTDVDPITNSVNQIEFFVSVTDPDGASDINTSSVNASVSFHQTGVESAITNGSYGCISKGNIDSNTANFSCSVTFNYFQTPGIWNITVYARDLGALSNVANTSQTFDFDTLQATTLHPVSLTFPTVSIGATNQTANNDPIIANNTGNFNFTSISINSTNILGQTNASEFIPAANFSVGVTSVGVTAEECGLGQGDTQVNDTVLAPQVFKLVDIANLTRGNYSLNDNVTGQEGLFFCIRQVPTDISSQTYATTATSPWTIQLT